MSAKKQPKKQDQQALGQQPEAGDDLDERQRQGRADEGRRSDDVEREQPSRVNREDNGAGQNRLNEG